MKVKELIEILKDQDEEKEVVLFEWDDKKGESFIPLCNGATQTKENEFIMILDQVSILNKKFNN